MKKKKSNRKLWIGIVVGVLLLGILGHFMLYQILFAPNGKQLSEPIHITKNTDYQGVVKQITELGAVKNINTFHIVARLLKYDQYPKKGKYYFEEGESNLDMVRKLRRGQHYPVKFTFNNVRTKEQLIEKIGDKFLFDVQDFAQLLQDQDFLQNYGCDTLTVLTLFLPDTYEFFYDLEAEEFFDRIYSLYSEFWTPSRKERAAELNLTPQEVSILASIVEEENHREKEKGLIAGLYINRLQKGMKLQADPTVKFALGDFSIKRILHRDLEVESPYNTYLHFGLPPGPLRIPEKSTLDSVLYHQPHQYLFMCAKDDLSGYHNFARTDREHQNNAARYHRALNRLKQRP